MRRLIIVSVVLALSLGRGGTLATEEEPPANGAFSPTGSLAVPRFFHTATPLPDGRVLVVGDKGRDDAPASAEVWDPITGTFEPARSLAEAPMNHTATLLSDGRILVVGGWGVDGFLASAEVWDPTTSTFGPAGSLAEKRVGHTATLLPDGRVLVIGGEGSDEDDPLLASAEVWDPATASFSPAGSLAKGRYVHTATLLPDGRVLVVGGWGVETALTSAEVWDPGDG